MISPLEDGHLPPFGALARVLDESRDPAVTAAAARSTIWSALSLLTASPSGTGLDSDGLQQLIDRISLAAGALPYDFEFAALLREAASLHEAATRDAFARAYAAVFETGEPSPPLPLRQEAAPGAGAQATEEVARFYARFGFELGTDRQWQPDHLPVMLEFLHFLAFHECSASERPAVVSLQLGQRDFLARYVLGWLPWVAKRLDRQAQPRFLVALFEGVADFARADHDWLTSVVGPGSAATP